MGKPARIQVYANKLETRKQNKPTEVQHGDSNPRLLKKKKVLFEQVSNLQGQYKDPSRLKMYFLWLLEKLSSEIILPSLGKAPQKCRFSRSVVSDSVIPWTVAQEAPPSTGFSRPEYWSG